MIENKLLLSYAWSAAHLHQALLALAKKKKFLSEKTNRLNLSGYSGPADNQNIDLWMTATAQQMGLETEAVELSYSELEHQLQQVGPALIRLPGLEALHFLVLLGGHRRKIKILTPNHTIQQLSPNELRKILAHDLEKVIEPKIQSLLTEAEVPQERQTTTIHAILCEQLGSTPITGCWLLRLSPGDSFFKQIRQAHLPRHLVVILTASFLGQLLMLLGWWVIGQGALSGHFEWAWMSAWALLLFTAMPLQLVIVWAENLISLKLGSLFKRRLLYGILQLEPEEIRHQGSGQFLGLVMEADSLESLALGGGLTALVALLELAIAAGVLAIGAGGWFHVLLLMSWLKLTTVVCGYYYLRSNQWVTLYREMTNDLVERMVGHRTRLAQEEPAHWHDEEDEFLERYLNYSKQIDRTNIAIKAIIQRGWLVVGLFGIAYTFVMTPTASVALAVSLGGILLASQALSHFVIGISSFISIVITWRQVGPLFKAAARGRQKSSVSKQILPLTFNKKSTTPVLAARNLTFRYQPNSPLILDINKLNIYFGDHLLLEGPSGGGKSTLSAIIAGLRQPESGQLSLWGIDQQLLDRTIWRKRMVTAPQFHENHILTETFAFNLLMGRRWPPLPQDLKEAEAICQELGLGDLLERMPAGFQQMVGESGWQLSHGERSRLYIARALLQQADLIILDESFAALDPENLERALQCVLHRASTLLVIAHP